MALCKLGHIKDIFSYMQMQGLNSKYHRIEKRCKLLQLDKSKHHIVQSNEKYHRRNSYSLKITKDTMTIYGCSIYRAYFWQANSCNVSHDGATIKKG